MEETTSAERQALLEQDDHIVTWWGSLVECVSALSRVHREGRFDAGELSQSHKDLQTLRDAWLEVQPTERVRRRALRLLRVHALRGADALQLAAALTAAEEDPASLEFVSNDTRLSTAAEREGFQVL